MQQCIHSVVLQSEVTAVHSEPAPVGQTLQQHWCSKIGEVLGS